MKKLVVALAWSASFLVAFPARADSEINATYNMIIGVPSVLLTSSTVVPLVRNLIFVGDGERGSTGWVTYGLSLIHI